MGRHTENALLDNNKSKPLAEQLKSLPEGQIVGVKWFDQNGISRNMLECLRKNGLIKRLAKGVYVRSVSNVEYDYSWECVVNSLQNVLELPIHVGGNAALELQGIMHYIRFSGLFPVDLYSYGVAPNWIQKLNCDGTFTVRNASKLFEENAPGLNVGFKRDFMNCSTIISSIPRALCELIDLADDNWTFHDVDMLMDMAWDIDPNEVQSVLEACKSIKVKRVFLFFADRNNLEWMNDLNLEKINLGSGVRQIIEGGEYDPKFKITVPRDLDAQAGDLVDMDYVNSDVTF